MTADIKLTSLEQITFRDGFVFTLSNVGILVWEGDLTQGYFNKAMENSSIKYFHSASPSQLQDFVTFTQQPEGG